MPIEGEYEAEIGREGDRFKPAARMTEIMACRRRVSASGSWTT
jgi:hypothetical protein